MKINPKKERESEWIKKTTTEMYKNTHVSILWGGWWLGKRVKHVAVISTRQKMFLKMFKRWSRTHGVWMWCMCVAFHPAVRETGYDAGKTECTCVMQPCFTRISLKKNINMKKGKEYNFISHSVGIVCYHSVVSLFKRWKISKQNLFFSFPFSGWLLCVWRVLFRGQGGWELHGKW